MYTLKSHNNIICYHTPWNVVEGVTEDLRKHHTFAYYSQKEGERRIKRNTPKIGAMVRNPAPKLGGWLCIWSEAARKNFKGKSSRISSEIATITVEVRSCTHFFVCKEE